MSAHTLSTLASSISGLIRSNSNILLFTFLVILLPSLAILARQIKMQNATKDPFRFLDLPPELRNQVYEYLVEDPYYPIPPNAPKQNQSPLRWIYSGRKPAAAEDENAGSRKCNWIFLANKQVYSEFMDTLCRKTTFHLSVSPQNYPQFTPSTPSQSSPSTPTEAGKRIWSISPETLKNLRKCDIKLTTTSSMLGVSDPRFMIPNSWALSRQVRQELAEVDMVKELNLHVKAIGDPLWNPLWVWYHASQSFKNMGSVPSTDKFPAGPKFHRITFSLDTWSPGENYLERDADGKWAWWCMKGHCVGADGGADMAVREFCARLYLECGVCSPVTESEE